MVNTRPTAGGIGDNNGGLTTTTTVDLNTTLLSMQRSMEQMNENIKGLLIFQQFATGEINRMTSGEGTSRGRGGGSQYGRQVQKRFDSVFEDPMVELKNLKHVTTVQLYQEQFEALMNKVDLSESYAISLFIGGLKEEISMSVRMFQPNTLTDVYCLAKMQEAALLVTKSRQTPLLPSPKSTYANTNSYVNPALALPAPNTGNRPSYVQNRKQLTQREIADKRANNLCFHCDQKFVPGHKCSGQLFSLEICADEGEMLENDVLEVDLCLAREIS
ncbi:hypothetical protein Tco_1232151 [Tanacetum coccineum]